MLKFLASLNSVDLLFLIVILLFMLIGIKKGMLQSIFHFSVSVLAVLIAAVGASQLSSMVAESVQPIVSEAIAGQITAGISSGDGILGSIGSMFAATSESAVQSLSDQIASGIMLSLQSTVIHTALFVLIFIFVLLVWTLFIANTKVVDTLPAIKGLDQLFGAICGILIGIVLYLVLLYIANHCGFVQTAEIENSLFLGKVVKFLGILV